RLSFIRLLPAPMFALFPYTTLFRSDGCEMLAISLPVARSQTTRSSLADARYRACGANTHSVSMSLKNSRWSSRPLLSHCRKMPRSEEHTSELQSRGHLVCRLQLEKK